MFEELAASLAGKEILKRPPEGSVYVAEKDDQGENPNDYFGTTDDVVAQVTEMEELDPKLFGLVQTRKLAVLSLESGINGDGVEADFAREVFYNISDMHTVLYEMLSAIPVGFSVMELVWGVLDSKFVITAIKARKQTRFKFHDKTNELLLITEQDTEGKRVNPSKFAVTTFQPKYSNRYGQALYMKLYWYWFIKKKSVKFWSIFTERFAVPVVIVKEGKNTSPKDKLALDNFVKKIRTAIGIKIPEDVIIEFLQAQQAGTITTYTEFMGYLDTSVAIAVLGQTLTSDTGKTGSYALGKIHENVRGDILLADIFMVEQSVNDNMIKPLVDFNFSNVKTYPRWSIAKGRAINQKEIAEVIEILGKAGFKKTPESYVHSTFGIPVPKEGEATLEMGSPTAPPPGGGIGQSSFAAHILKMEQDTFLEDLRKLG